MIVALVLDESGSMSGNKQAALAGINEYIESMKEEYKDKPELGDIYFSFVTFSSSYGSGKDDVRFVYNLRHISEVEKIPSTAYTPSGGTPLLQAIGRTMESLDDVEGKNEADSPLIAFMSNKDVEEAKVVMVVQTDGQETEWNGKYSKEQITKMIKEREDRGNWTFVFLGAGIDAISEGMKMGLGASASYTMNNSVDSEMAYGSTYTGAALETSKLRGASVKRSANFVADMGLSVKEIEKTGSLSAYKKLKKEKK